MGRVGLGVLVVLLTAAAARAQPVGAYEIAVTAAPAEVREGEPLTLTLRITGKAAKNDEPARPDLRQLAQRKLDDDFFLEPPAEPSPKRPEANVWEFTYLLRPKHTQITTLPTFKFVYKDARGNRKQAFTRETVELVVKPRAQANLDPGKILAPPGTFAVAGGDAVLRGGGPSWWFEPWALALLALTPPALCVAWYYLYGLLFPDAARLRRLLHARATRAALRALKRAPAAGGAATAAVVAHYLRQRLGLAASEPTPAEVAACLQQAGASPQAASSALRLFAACDQARFAPVIAAASLTGDAAKFIHQLEAELCARPS